MSRKEMVPNAIFRKRFQELEEKESLTLAEVAHRVGWVAKDARNGKEKPDSSRVARTLGIAAEAGTTRNALSYDTAILMCRALHVDYFEVGI